jgi:hypothetical protein
MLIVALKSMRLKESSARKRLEGSTFALLTPLLAAPCGPSAMRFLRRARSFGWLDPRLICFARRPIPTTSVRLVALAETLLLFDLEAG